jgi:beta-lactamase regulating signal transducer with metallopeptidase domain
MTTFAIALVTAALQVTLVAVPAVAVIAWAGRRSPRTGANLAITALLACALLSVVAVAPLPHWWTWDAPAEMRPGPPAPEVDQVVSTLNSDTVGWRIPFGRLTALLSTPVPSPADAKSRWTAWTFVVGIFFAGLAIEVIRLLAGLRAVAAIRRRSIPVQELIAEMDEMRREFGVTGAVSIRQSAAVGTAATIGWRRPVILLAVDWPTWDAAERRAVLAHELAHVHRRDYLTSLLAALCRAAHFYHPLVRWLAARLRLHQELAADALAAAAVGGREGYLRTLARMALRQDAAVVAGMARPFLSDRTSLLRRITMLRVTDDNRPLSRATRWGLGVVLGLVAFGASAVRGPAQGPVATGGLAVDAADIPPFDVSQVPACSNLLMALRPAAVLTRPGMKPFADRLNRQIAAASHEAGFPLDVLVPLNEIEQIVMASEGRKMSPPPGRAWKPDEPQHAVMLNLILVRMTHNFDWPAVIRSGATAFKAEVSEVKPGLFRVAGKVLTMHFRVVDPRTICLLDFESVPKNGSIDALLAQMKPAADPAAAWGPAWPKAERAAAVMAYDNRKGFWKESASPGIISAQLTAALGRPTHVISCLDLVDAVTAHLYATTDATGSADQRPKLDAFAVAALANCEAGATQTKGQDVACRIIREALEGRSIRRDGTTDIAEFRSPAKLADLLAVIDFPEVVEERSP